MGFPLRDCIAYKLDYRRNVIRSHRGDKRRTRVKGRARREWCNLSCVGCRGRQRKVLSRITRIRYDGDSWWSWSWSMSDRYTPRQRALFARGPCVLRLLAINYPRLFGFYVSRGAYTQVLDAS